MDVSDAFIDGMSEDVQKFIKTCTHKINEYRLTSREMASHPWIRKNVQIVKKRQQRTNNCTKDLLNNYYTYIPQNKLPKPSLPNVCNTSGSNYEQECTANKSKKAPVKSKPKVFQTLHTTKSKKGRTNALFEIDFHFIS